MAGNPIFGIDIAGIVAETIAPGLHDVTITSYTRGARNPSSLSAGPAITSQQITGVKGFWEDYQPNQIDGTGILLNDRKACLIGNTMGSYVPREGDVITIHEPIGDVALGIVRQQSRDPAAALYVIQCGDRTGPDGQ